MPASGPVDVADDLFQRFGVTPGEGLDLDVPSAPGGRSYITYVFKDGDEIVYVGRASGTGTPTQVMQQRIAKGHAHFLPGYSYEIVDVQGSKLASQGAEEFFMQGYQGLGANLGNINEAVDYSSGRAAGSLSKLEAFFIDLFSRE